MKTEVYEEVHVERVLSHLIATELIALPTAFCVASRIDEVRIINERVVMPELEAVYQAYCTPDQY